MPCSHTNHSIIHLVLCLLFNMGVNITPLFYFFSLCGHEIYLILWYQLTFKFQLKKYFTWKSNSNNLFHQQIKGINYEWMKHHLSSTVWMYFCIFPIVWFYVIVSLFSHVSWRGCAGVGVVVGDGERATVDWRCDKCASQSHSILVNIYINMGAVQITHIHSYIIHVIKPSHKYECLTPAWVCIMESLLWDC